MPFTFCHPAIILPLTKSKKLSTSALIIGSTAPDFEYFLRMDMVRSHSHDFWAIFYFNLPLTLVLYFIFQTIVKIPLINHSPDFLYYRFNKYLKSKSTLKSFNQVKWIMISATIGIFSHLLWDSFTHREGFFEGKLPLLLKQFTFLGKEYILFEFLQTWCSILGGFYILYFVLKMPRKYKYRDFKLIKFWGIAFICSFLVIYLRNCTTPQQFIATSISSGFIGLILSSSFTKIHDHLKLKKIRVD
jgi:hypothetical protein